MGALKMNLMNLVSLIRKRQEMMTSQASDMKFIILTLSQTRRPMTKMRKASSKTVTLNTLSRRHRLS